MAKKPQPPILPLHSLMTQFGQQPRRVGSRGPAVPPAPLQPVAPPAPTPPVKPAIPENLPPSVPAATFVASDTWEAQRVGALAIYCSDGRWNEACDEFCHAQLHIPRYDRFVLPGGPAFLAQSHSGKAALFEANRPQLDYLVVHHQLERIVLITHYACGFYHDLLSLDPDGCLPIQMQDVRAAADLLHQWYPKLAIEGYLAMRLGDRLSFHRLQT